METVDYAALTSAGAVIATFGDRSMALAWSEVEGSRFPGWRLVKIQRVELIRTTTIRRDRSQEEKAA